MTPAQLKRRKELFARNDSALDRWPDRSGEDFVREMTAVAEALKKLAQKVDAAGDDRLESSRNWRYVGNAYFDLANAKDLSILRLAVDAYEKSDASLAGIDDAVERMKLDYSYGNALFHLSDAKDLDLLQEARRRYASALEIAKAQMPGAVSLAQKALLAADRVIALLTQAEGLSQRITELKSEIEEIDSEPGERPDPLHEMGRSVDRVRHILGHLGDVERRVQSDVPISRDELGQAAQEIDELRDVSAKMGSAGPWDIFYRKYSSLLHDHLQAAGLRPETPKPVAWDGGQALKQLSEYARQSVADNQTVDFVHNLFLVVNRFDAGESVSDAEVQSILARMDEMAEAVLDLTAKHPQLAGQFSRVRRRFLAHLAQRAT